jgi:hypothetical protein
VKRSSNTAPREFEGFDMRSPLQRDTAWLLSTAGYGSNYDEYDYYDDYEDGLVVPDEWESMEPKYVNGRQVQFNLQIQ